MVKNNATKARTRTTSARKPRAHKSSAKVAQSKQGVVPEWSRSRTAPEQALAMRCAEVGLSPGSAVRLADGTVLYFGGVGIDINGRTGEQAAGIYLARDPSSGKGFGTEDDVERGTDVMFGLDIVHVWPTHVESFLASLKAGAETETEETLSDSRVPQEIAEDNGESIGRDGELDRLDIGAMMAALGGGFSNGSEDDDDVDGPTLLAFDGDEGLDEDDDGLDID